MDKDQFITWVQQFAKRQIRVCPSPGYTPDEESYNEGRADEANRIGRMLLAQLNRISEEKEN